MRLQNTAHAVCFQHLYQLYLSNFRSFVCGMHWYVFIIMKFNTLESWLVRGEEVFDILFM